MNDYETEFKQVPEANIFHSKVTPTNSSGIFEVMYKYSNYYTILNIIAQCFRAIHITSQKNKLSKGNLKSGKDMSYTELAVR